MTRPKFYSWSACGGVCPHGDHETLGFAQECAAHMNGTGAPVPFHVFKAEEGREWVLIPSCPSSSFLAQEGARLQAALGAALNPYPAPRGMEDLL